MKDNISCYVPKPKAKSKTKKNELFSKADFQYDAGNDYYICPANQKLTYGRHVKWANKKEQKEYCCASCRGCSLRSQCLGEIRSNRYIFRGIDEDLLDQMEQRVLANPEITKRAGGAPLWRY